MHDELNLDTRCPNQCVLAVETQPTQDAEFGATLTHSPRCGSPRPEGHGSGDEALSGLGINSLAVSPGPEWEVFGI